MFPEDLIEGARGESPALYRRTDLFSRFALPEDADAHEPPKPRLWLHLLLLLLTFFTTTLVGAHMQYNFSHNLPFLDLDRYSAIFTTGLQSWSRFASGLPFSLTLLTILMAHELGHYLACVYYRVDASLPYFLPSPMPVTGTFGAFIRIRSAIRSKRVLFDIGVAGPIAGFIFLVPALGVGLAFSKVLPGINHQGAIQLGVPALQWLAQQLIFPGVPASDIYLHPVARAAWVGMFATALNLLPVGQLDGGHVVYALLGRSQKWITNIFLVALLPMGKLWSGWWFWAVMLFFFARKHPPLYDPSGIGASRARLGVLALCIFILCFSLAPISE
ncbi:MAG: site-2 protease family protein [Acidobacteriota bacterium]|nr:site-2 protease family protein [Acidobacteriota bacterium]